MRLMSSCVLIYAMSSLQWCMPCIFVINVVTSTSMQTRLRDVADFSPCSAVILMPCKHDATERFMHILVLSLTCLNSMHTAPFCACNMSNCSSQRVHHLIPLHHVHLSPS